MFTFLLGKRHSIAMGEREAAEFLPHLATRRDVAASTRNLAFSALMLAGLDGIRRRLDPGEPLDADIYDLPAERLANIGTVPASLEASLDALEADHEFLCVENVFPPELIEAYIRYKREAEIDAIRMRPHPWEFALYHDA